MDDMRLRTITTAVALLLTVLVSGASAAQAQPAQQADPPSPENCWRFEAGDPIWGISCFQVNGDDQWVKDDEANGWAVGAQIQTNYGKTRWCANRNTAGSWVECKFDHRENTCVRFRLYEQDGGADGPTRNWTAWTPWLSTTYYDFC
jgi:hypothetical protein